MRGCNPLTSSPAIKLSLLFSEKDYVEKTFLPLHLPIWGI